MSTSSLIPKNAVFTPVAMFDIWKVGVMSFELWATSIATIAMRNQLWYTQAPSSAHMIKENQRMVTEKLEAGMEVGLAMQKTLLNMAAGTFAPWWVTSRSALLPLHRRTMANSRRLSQRRK